MALLVYAALQLAEVVNWVQLDAQSIPLFFRWRMASLVGAVTAVVSCILDVHRRVAWLATWAMIMACVVTAIVVALAP